MCVTVLLVIFKLQVIKNKAVFVNYGVQ